MKYLELFKNGFDSTIDEKIKPENWPYVAYSTKEGRVVCTSINKIIIPELVDLGLPSGLKWANMNVGATSPEESGNYYAWGETDVKDVYNWDTYKYTQDLTKYNSIDNINILEPQDDVATQLYGDGWKIPNYSDLQELFSNTYYKNTSLNGVKGIEFISNINGNTIFFPMAGVVVNDSVRDFGDYAEYTTSQANRNDYSNAGSFCITPNGGSYARVLTTQYRYIGCTIRPVHS